MKDLFKRVVTLEQRTYHQTIWLEEAKEKIKTLEEERTILAAAAGDQSGIFCQGRYLWRLYNFTTIIAKMREGKGHTQTM